MIKYTVEIPKIPFPVFGDLKIGSYFCTAERPVQAPDRIRVWRKISASEAILATDNTTDNTVLTWGWHCEVIVLEPEGEIVFRVKTNDPKFEPC